MDIDITTLRIAATLASFVTFIGILVWDEARLTRVRLGDYVNMGWLTHEEVDMLATSRGRRAGIAWARTLPGDRVRHMKDFIADSTALAAARQRALTGRDPHAAEDEKVFLARAGAARVALLSR